MTPSDRAKIEQRVAEWHNGQGDGQELWEYLGMSVEQYALWVTSPSALGTPTYCPQTGLTEEDWHNGR